MALKDEAADLIEKLTDRCARYAEEIAVLQEREQWVPVTERLTQRLRTGEVLMASEYEEKYTEQEWISVLQDCLAAYEDTGLTPERCAEFARADAEGRYIVMRDAEQEGVARLRELAEADKDGRLVLLPVKPVLTPILSSMLYIIEDGDIYEDALYEAVVGMSENGETNVVYTTLSDQITFEQSDIGKTVFLTREAAEKTLEAMKDD